jgi:hypothetical protein
MPATASEPSGGRCEGQKPVPPEILWPPESWRVGAPKNGQAAQSAAISAELAPLGYLGPGDKPYFPGSVARMLA